MTIAKTGRSIKKRAMARPRSVRRVCGRAIEVFDLHRRDLERRARSCLLQSLDDDTVAGGEAGLDHLPIAEAGPEFDGPQLGVVAFTNDGQEVLAELLPH